MKKKAANSKPIAEDVGQTTENKIAIFEAIKKSCLILVAAVVAFAGCVLSRESKSPINSDTKDVISGFVFTHSHIFFLIILALLIIQLIVYFIRFLHENSILSEKVDKVEKESNQGFLDIGTRCKEVSDKISDVNFSLQTSGENTISNVKDQNFKINNCLKNIQTVHIVNQSKYNDVHGKIYRYVNKACTEIDDRFKRLLEQYSEEKT